MIGRKALHVHVIAARPKQVFIEQHDAMIPRVECSLCEHGEREHANRKRRRKAERAHQRRHAEHLA